MNRQAAALATTKIAASLREDVGFRQHRRVHWRRRSFLQFCAQQTGDDHVGVAEDEPLYPRGCHWRDKNERRSSAQVEEGLVAVVCCFTVETGCLLLGHGRHYFASKRAKRVHSNTAALPTAETSPTRDLFCLFSVGGTTLLLY